MGESMRIHHAMHYRENARKRNCDGMSSIHIETGHSIETDRNRIAGILPVKKRRTVVQFDEITFFSLRFFFFCFFFAVKSRLRNGRTERLEPGELLRATIMKDCALR